MPVGVEGEADSPSLPNPSLSSSLLSPRLMSEPVWSQPTSQLPSALFLGPVFPLALTHSSHTQSASRNVAKSLVLWWPRVLYISISFYSLLSFTIIYWVFERLRRKILMIGNISWHRTQLFFYKPSGVALIISHFFSFHEQCYKVIILEIKEMDTRSHLL